MDYIFWKLPKDFGDGWLSKNANDLVRVIVGFVCPTEAEAVEFIKRIAFSSPNRKANVRTVERIIDEMGWAAKNEGGN